MKSKSQKRRKSTNRKKGKPGQPGRGKNFLTILGIVVVVLVAGGWITVYQVTHVEPEWPAEREGDPVPERPEEGDPPFHREPLAPTLEERQDKYLEWAKEEPTPEGRNGIWAEVAKLEAGDHEIDNAVLDYAMEFVDERNDCADFVVGGLLRLYYKFAGTDQLTEEQEEDIKQTLLDFKYWLDEPNPTDAAMELYTENHQIMARSSEYLAGQLFPDEIFTNVDEDGQWRMERAKDAITEWIEWRAQVGFAEWNSIPYYPINLGALLNLIDFADDEELVKKATMMVDLILFDIVVDSYYGQYGTTHGRISGHHVKSASGDTLVTSQAILWGLGRFQTNSNMGAVSLATTENYDPPPVLDEIAHHHPEELKNFERHSINVSEEDAEKYGVDFESTESAKVWLAMGAFLEPPLLDLSYQVANEWDLWHIAGEEPLLKELAQLGYRLNLLEWGVKNLGVDYTGAKLSEVNKVTYSTPDYMLSTAQDYRPGEKGYQQHIWQATLSPYAVTFVTNPGSLREDNSHRPSYWAGNSRLPRNAQHRNLLISLYDIDEHKGLLEPRHFSFTHAYFPRWAFDEVTEVGVEEGGGWIFGKKDEGYMALYSHLPYEWQEEGPDADQEVIALGNQNVWICFMGNKEEDGSFEEFVEEVSDAPLDVDGLEVAFEAPGLGTATFGWEEPLKVDGEEIPLEEYPRWDNPYSSTDFNSKEFTISHEGETLHLDFATNERIIE